ncbi:MAG: Flp pilus assembly complex ATPase component TadA [Phycisphaerales bacterium]|nr:Flp pilus assembly complex ATPase component TadA [Phycisphaerales bacterium]
MSLGLLLVERGVINQEALERALADQRASGERLDRILLRHGSVGRQQVLDALGEQFHLPIVDLAEVRVDQTILQMLPAQVVSRQSCVPIAHDSGTLTVATSDPGNLFELDELRLLTGCAIEVALADEDELHKFIRAHYGVGSDTLEQLAAGAAPTVTLDESDADVQAASEASVIRLVNDILGEAIAERATDVHIEPYERELTVRYRIDGVLQRANVPATIHRFGAAIISRIKIMANLNIAEKRKPQDGRITLRHKVEGKVQEFDLRVSVIPMLFGEGVVLRVLNKSAVLMNLEDLGMPAGLLKRWDALISRPHGILLVTGPTGSGKSTTLYGSLNRIVSDEIKAITVEDPVEYHVAGVNQIQVNTKVGLTFSAGLRSVLRHDPDVVMIGEIRDHETAETAVQASLTGHLVFSTLHTNDAAGATTRLLDMGVEPFLVASSVEGILAQRLVRRVCKECARPTQVDQATLPSDFPGANTLMVGAGCRACRNTGYRGRVGVFELFTMTDRAREMVMHRKNAREIALASKSEGALTTLREDGFAKVLAGHTTLNEVMTALAE